MVVITIAGDRSTAVILVTPTNLFFAIFCYYVEEDVNSEYDSSPIRTAWQL